MICQYIGICIWRMYKGVLKSTQHGNSMYHLKWKLIDDSDCGSCDYTYTPDDDDE